MSLAKNVSICAFLNLPSKSLIKFFEQFLHGNYIESV